MVAVMSEIRFYDGLLTAWFGLAAVSAVALFFVSAPYGRYFRRGWGPSISSTVGWLVMEMPSGLMMAALWASSDRRANPASAILAALWVGHYVYRAFVFPFIRRGQGHPMPLAIVGMACLFNLVNAYLNGRWLFAFGPERGATWLIDPRFAAGLALVILGFATHVTADRQLAGLRAPGDTTYRIPRGLLFDWISCPNYLGETLEWTGWALAAWSWPALSFAVWTAANLVPRALTHHRWYRAHFADYPAERKAILPGLL
jgi:protein-S-isoprenylcysteine O-methyltransferase Ste14